MKSHPYLVILMILTLACGAPPKEKTSQAKSTGVSEGFINKDKRINSFIYHRFGDPRYPSTNVSLENFEAHLQYLKEAEFELMTFSDAIGYLKDSSPAKSVAVITIDDAFKSFYENGLPLLEKYSFPATLFVNTKTVGGASYMDWIELKDAMKRGIEIGNHTHSHDFYLNLDKQDRYNYFESEIKICQELIESNLKVSPTVFAYPYGEFDTQMQSIVREAGFIAAAAQYSGVINHLTDLMACPRFPMATGFDDISGFKLKANSRALDLQGSPDDHLVKIDKPILNLTLDKASLRIAELQCFIQGSECNLSKQQVDDSTYNIKVQTLTAITERRRTLYTLTVPDRRNQWYWYSFLWINPKVAE